MKDTSIQITWIKDGIISNDFGKLFLTLPTTCHRGYGSREMRLRYSQQVRLSSNHDSAYSPWLFLYSFQTYRRSPEFHRNIRTVCIVLLNILLTIIMRISLPRGKCLELWKFFPFHCKYPHTLQVTSLVHPGSGLVIWILGADILFLLQIQYLASLFHDYCQHFGDKLRLFLVKMD